MFGARVCESMRSYYEEGARLWPTFSAALSAILVSVWPMDWRAKRTRLSMFRTPLRGTDVILRKPFKMMLCLWRWDAGTTT